MDKVTTLSHDGFARASTVRRIVRGKARPCVWCGQYRSRLFMYGTQHDDSGRVYWSENEFCGIGCYRAYYGY